MNDKTAQEFMMLGQAEAKRAEAARKKEEAEKAEKAAAAASAAAASQRAAAEAAAVERVRIHGYFFLGLYLRTSLSCMAISTRHSTTSGGGGRAWAR